MPGHMLTFSLVQAVCDGPYRLDAVIRGGIVVTIRRDSESDGVDEICGAL
jgi:hypothetical protein